MFWIKYLTLYNVQLHISAIRELLYGCAHVREIILELKLVNYLPVHTHKHKRILDFDAAMIGKQL